MGIYSSTMAERKYHTPTPADVEQVRTYLRCFFPVELANLIINYAIYWPKVSYTASQNNDPLIVTQDTGPRCCGITPKISRMIGSELAEGTFWKVKMVKFRVSSHDQGWCSQNDFKERYAGSWTWFEAAIAREVDDDSTSQKDDTRRNGIQQCIRDAISERGEDIPAGRQICTVDNVLTNAERSFVWHVQRNIRASREFTTHEVVWMDEEPLDEMDRVPGEEMRFVDATGSGKGRGFVSKLEPHDRIAVIGRALYPAWVNYVRDVEVDIYYSI